MSSQSTSSQTMISKYEPSGESDIGKSVAVIKAGFVWIGKVTAYIPPITDMSTSSFDSSKNEDTQMSQLSGFAHISSNALKLGKWEVEYKGKKKHHLLSCEQLRYEVYSLYIFVLYYFRSFFVTYCHYFQ
jgi:hypothetical protein